MCCAAASFPPCDFRGAQRITVIADSGPFCLSEIRAWLFDLSGQLDAVEHCRPGRGAHRCGIGGEVDAVGAQG